MPKIEVSEETFAKIKDQFDLDVNYINDLNELVGQKIMLQCARYIYHGVVEAVTITHIILKDAGVVFETGVYDAHKPKDRQSLPNPVYVMIQAIESFTKMKW